MRTFIVATLCSLSLAMCPPVAAAETPAQAALVEQTAQPQVRVAVDKGTAADTFDVSVVVTDRESGEVLATPTMTIRAGPWSRAEVGALEAPNVTSVSFAVTVDPPGKNVAYFADIGRADGSVDSESGTMRIGK